MRDRGSGGVGSDLSHCAPSAVRAYRRLSAGKGADWCATACVGRGADRWIAWGEDGSKLLGYLKYIRGYLKLIRGHR